MAGPTLQKLGQYHCVNRVYDVLQGRWTSLDPSSSPWSNLLDYVGNGFISLSDPLGLLPLIRTSRGDVDFALRPYADSYDPCSREVNLAKLMKDLETSWMVLFPAEQELLAVLKMMSTRVADWSRVRLRFDWKTDPGCIPRADAASRYVVWAGTGTQEISLSILAHELTHIYQQGGSYGSYFAWILDIGLNETIPNETGRKNAYAISAQQLYQSRWKDLGNEQQAEIVRAYVEGYIQRKYPVNIEGYGKIYLPPPNPPWPQILRLIADFMAETPPEPYEPEFPEGE